MSGGWTGFSDEDLRLLKTQKEKEPSGNMAKIKTARLQKMKTPDRRPTTSAAAGAPPSPPSTLSQMPSRPSPTSQPIPNQHASHKIPRERIQTDVVSESKISSSDASDVSVVKEEPRDIELNEKEGLSRELGCLEKFREQQKQIEEANKEKKKLLAKTLSERQRKAREEAEKLTHIQKELTILDHLLSADVTVIRDKIEVASREYLDAQRRYDKAEKEFIESKLDLQKKSELKEQLTEHLYTIIHQNEVRKATKLSELMNKLEMEQNSEGMNLQMGTLPPLSSFNTINSLQTLHSPKSPPPTSPTTVSPTKNHRQDKEVPRNQPTKSSSQKTSSEETSSQQLVNLSSTELPSSTVVISDQTPPPPPEVVTENLESQDPVNNVEKSNKDIETRSDINSEKSGSNVFNRTENSGSNMNNKNENEETQNLPSSWTLNLVDIKQEPDT